MLGSENDREVEKVEVLYSKFNSTRKPQYQISTTIYKDNHVKYCTKRALNKNATEHIQNIIANTDPALKIINADKESVTFEFVEGKSLHNKLMSAVSNKNEDEFFRILNQYHQYILKNETVEREIFSPNKDFVRVFGTPKTTYENVKCFVTSNIDLTLSNIIEREDRSLVTIDGEWVFNFEVPVKFCVYRILLRYMVLYPYIFEVFNLQKTFDLFSISQDDLSDFNSFERHFSETVHDTEFDFNYSKNITQIDSNAEEQIKQFGECISENGQLWKRVHSVENQNAQVISENAILWERVNSAEQQNVHILAENAVLWERVNSAELQNAKILAENALLWERVNFAEQREVELKLMAEVKTAEILHLQQTIELHVNSISWYITRPLRGAKKLFNRVLQRVKG